MKPATLARLGVTNPGPSVSIYLPLATAHHDTNRIRLKNAWSDCAQPMPLAVEDLLREPAAWDREARGLALLHGGDRTIVRWLPYAPESQVHVGERFHIAPLLPLLDHEQRFCVLALQLGEWTLLQCDLRGCVAIDVPNAPGSLQDATGAVVDPVPGGPSHANRFGAGNPKVHPQGFGHEDRRRNDAMIYFRDLDDALVSFVGTDAQVLVVGSAPWSSLYAGHTGLNLLGVEVRNPGDMSHAELHELGMGHVRDRLLQQREELLEEIHTAMSHDQGSDELDTVHTMAQRGGVDLMLVDPDSSDPRVDAAISATLAHGGRVLPMDTLEPVAARFRWSPTGA